MRPTILERPAAPAGLRGYAAAVLGVTAATLAGLAMTPRWGNSATDLLYLPGVLAAAMLGGLGPALLAAFGSGLAYLFFFTTPRFSFRIEDASDIVTVAVLLSVAVVTSQLAASVRGQARLARALAERSRTVANLAGRLLGCADQAAVVETAARELHAVFDCHVLLVGSGPGEPRVLARHPAPVELTPGDLAVAALVLDSGERAGRGVSRAVPTEWQFHPVRSAGGVIGAVGLARDDGAPAVERDRLPLLDSLLDQLALALERGRLQKEAEAWTRDRDRDRVRAALLSSIGQDLSPPLAELAAAVAELRRGGGADAGALSRLGAGVTRMDRYLTDLLDLDPGSDRPPLEIDGVTIDLFNRTVSRDGRELRLAPREWAVLAELAKHPGRVLSHAHLLRTAWGPAQADQIDYLRVAIRGLRQKLERHPSRPTLIVNEPAVGYRLKVD